MKFGISYISAIACLFSVCLAAATTPATRDHKDVKAAAKEEDLKKAIEALKPTMLTVENVGAAKKVGQTDTAYLDKFLNFDTQWSEAKEALKALTDNKDPAKKADLEKNYTKELEEAKKAYEDLGTHKDQFSKLMEEIEHKEKEDEKTKKKENNSETTEEHWYLNPWYIGGAVLVLVILLVCIWALFFRKKAEDL